MSTNENDHSRKKVVALRYDTESEFAPKMIVKGSGYIAEHILALAKDNDIHVHEDPDLLNVLSVLDIQSEIPEHLYLAVPEVLAFVYQLNNTLSGE